MKTTLILVSLLTTISLLYADANDGNFKAKITPPYNSNVKLPIMNSEEVVNNFRSEYQRANKPKLLLYVNRSLTKDRGEILDQIEIKKSIQTKGDPVATEGNTNVQLGSDIQTTKDKSPLNTGKGGERLDTTTGSVRVNSERELGVAPITEMEARMIEEAFQKPLFNAGAKIVDQKIAEISSQTFVNAADNFLTAPKTDPEKAEILSLRKSADVVIEILARKKNVLLPMPSGEDRIEQRLDLVATAISLKDGVKLAQISSDSLFGFNQRNGEARKRRAQQVTSAEIIEQTALALMQRLTF